jgi:hypothetical protein
LKRSQRNRKSRSSPAGLAAADDAMLPEPQLVKDLWALETFFEADPEAIKAVLPPGLTPHPSNTVAVNMYTVPEASNTSGFGAYTLTYIAVQVMGHDAYIYGSKDTVPGLYLVHYWNSSEGMRAYTGRAGFPNELGGMTTMQKDSGKVATRLSVNGKPFIEASSDLSGEPQPAAGGHANYLYRKGSQLMKLPLPWICRDVKTENAMIAFQMPPEHPAYKLRPKKISFAFHSQCTISYPQAVAIKP